MRQVLRLLIASIASLAMALPLAAEIAPAPTGGDPHIQSVEYDPHQVVALSVASGFALTVLFSPDERIETVTVGENSAWNIQVNNRADALVIKPVGFAPNTNLTVLSNQRAYNFTLSNANTGFGPQPFLVRFTYPVPESDKADQVPPVLAHYRFSGSRDLRPLEMWDDGAKTSIKWSEDSPLPAVYRDEGRKRLALLNGAMRDGAYVIEGIYERLVFIVGKTRTKAIRNHPGSDR